MIFGCSQLGYVQNKDGSNAAELKPVSFAYDGWLGHDWAENVKDKFLPPTQPEWRSV